ncbi:class I SAM-dependent methyltransferase [Pyrococcus kukulkanii]|uniref:class I SAM-dependent methyltransferase n=1 Tax=Pyrococcus kukulkanii TaxID=1609559 RepID=UPI003563F48F
MRKECLSLLTKIPNVEHRISSLIFYEYSISFLLDNIKKNTNIKVLDIGCSSGYGIYIMREICPTCSFVGIDINESGIIQAQRLLSKYSNVDILKLDITKQGTVEYLIDKYGKFDAITCFEVFEHITPEGSVTMLKNIYSLLSDDGLLFISTPNKRIYDVDAYTPDHINEVNAEEFLSLLESTSFEIIQVMGSHYIPPLLTRLLYQFDLIVRYGNIKNELSFQKKLLRYTLCSLLDPKRVVLTVLKRINFKIYLRVKSLFENLTYDYNNSGLVYVVARKKRRT